MNERAPAPSVSLMRSRHARRQRRAADAAARKIRRNRCQRHLLPQQDLICSSSDDLGLGCINLHNVCGPQLRHGVNRRRPTWAHSQDTIGRVASG